MPFKLSVVGNRDHKHRPGAGSKKIWDKVRPQKVIGKNMVHLDWENIKGKEMLKTKEQERMELSPELLLLEKKNSRLGEGAGG